MVPDMSRALPVKIRRRHLETPESYGRRLALANGLPADTPINAARQLAGTSNISALRKALAQWCETKGSLRLGHFRDHAVHTEQGLPQRTMCRLCAHGGTVEQFGHAESYCCLRHGLWTGPQTAPFTLTPIDDEIRAVEIRYRRLRRAGRVPVVLVQELAVIVNRHRGENSIETRLDAGNYSDVVSLAELLTNRSFQHDLLNPTRTFAEARRLLEVSIGARLPISGAILVDGLWRLLRPAFLAVRDKVDGQNHAEPEICRLLGIDPGGCASTTWLQRPMEPFGRYLELLESSLADQWANACEVTLVAGQGSRPRAASRQGVWMASFICRQGHWHRRTLNTASSALKVGRDGCPYCAGLRALAGYNSMAETHPALAAEWHLTLNGATTPSKVTGAGNSSSYWWTCLSGHEWQATPNNRAKGQGCPYCSGRRCMAGFNSVDVTHPRIAAEWNYRLNASNEPSMFTAGSGALIEWICPLGHEYASPLTARTGAGKGCPICANLKVLVGFNDLATSHPQVAEQWHPGQNGTVTPQTVVAGSGRRYYWRCPAGHDYVAAVSSRTNGSGCPVCAGQRVLVGFNDLRSTHPLVAVEWDTERNGNRTPESVIAGSNWRAQWICRLGHSYAKRINERAAGSGCQYCSNRKVLRGFNDLATRHPEIARDWHPERNEALAASEVVPGNAKRWWKCLCGHEHFGSVPNRIKTRGCPLCAPDRRVLTNESAFARQDADVDGETRGVADPPNDHAGRR